MTAETKEQPRDAQAGQPADDEPQRIVIRKWMGDSLHLTGNMLVCYALVRTMAQPGQWAEIPYRTARQWCGCSGTTVRNCMDRLERMGLVESAPPVRFTGARRYRLLVDRAD